MPVSGDDMVNIVRPGSSGLENRGRSRMKALPWLVQPVPQFLLCR